jgi:lipopolysaccharide biosynthesis glycosyltransferase
MKTKIVYVLVSSVQDIYLEQAWVSIFSLRHFNKDTFVSIVCDNKTADRIEASAPQDFKELVSEVVKIPFDETVSNKERSRCLKTNLRNLVSGDFLFLDTDTIITDSLTEIDSFDYDLGMVYAWHCKMIDRPNRSAVLKRIKTLFDVVPKAETDYFNSGVIFCKDTEKNHRFFDKWHEYWLSAKDKPKGIQDQQSLMVTVDELGGVCEMPGEYNCQPVYSMKYISTAKVVHFFNLKWVNHEWSPFCSDDFYLNIKNKGNIDIETMRLILNCRLTFLAPTMCILGDDINIWRSPAFTLLRGVYRIIKYLRQNWGIAIMR